MAHLDWILPAVGGYLGGLLTGLASKLFEHVGKHSFDRATELKELIAKIKREIEAFEAFKGPSRLGITRFALGPSVSPEMVRVTPIFNQYASDLKTNLDLIRWYFLMRFLASLPPRKNVQNAAELLPQLAVQEVGAPITLVQPRQEALFIAKKIKKLLG